MLEPEMHFVCNNNYLGGRSVKYFSLAFRCRAYLNNLHRVDVECSREPIVDE